MIHDVKMEMTPADPKHHHNKHIIMGKGTPNWFLNTYLILLETFEITLKLHAEKENNSNSVSNQQVDHYHLMWKRFLMISQNQLVWLVNSSAKSLTKLTKNIILSPSKFTSFSVDWDGSENITWSIPYTQAFWNFSKHPSYQIIRNSAPKDEIWIFIQL